MTKPVAIHTTLYWASLNTKNDLSGKYQVDLGNLSDAAVMALEGIGIDVKNKPDLGNYISCKSTTPIKAVDEQGIALNPETLVGNGSKAKAAVSFYDWKYMNKSGRSPSLVKLMVTDLVEYGNSANIDDLDFL